MFEAAELGHKISKAEYKTRAPLLREALLEAQYELKEQARFPVVILINGVDGAGKGETVNLLNEWMDPRHIQAWAFDTPTPEEAERPFMWRFWRALPPHGKIGVLFNNWYTQPIRDRVDRVCKRAELDQRLDEIRRFEAMLAHEGVLLIKFWFHLSKDAQKKPAPSRPSTTSTWRSTTCRPSSAWRRWKRCSRPTTWRSAPCGTRVAP